MFNFQRYQIGLLNKFRLSPLVRISEKNIENYIIFTANITSNIALYTSILKVNNLFIDRQKIESHIIIQFAKAYTIQCLNVARKNNFE